MDKIKLNVELEKILDDNNKDYYRVVVNGEPRDWFELNHANKCCEKNLYLESLVFFGIEYDSYEDYLSVFNIQPPMAQQNVDMVIKIKESELSDGTHQYEVFLDGIMFDFFKLNHKDKTVHTQLDTVYRKLLKVETYEDYLRVFKINPPMTGVENND